MWAETIYVSYLNFLDNLPVLYDKIFFVDVGDIQWHEEFGVR